MDLETLFSRGQPDDAAQALAQMESCWLALYHAAGDVPQRAQVDPTAFPAALPHAFVLDRVAPSVARFRVAGQALAAHLGMDPRGMPLSIFFAPGARDALSRHMIAMFDQPAVLSLPLATPKRFGQRGVTGRMVLLPLRGPTGEINRALGGIIIDREKNGGSKPVAGPEAFMIGPEAQIGLRPCDPRRSTQPMPRLSLVRNRVVVRGKRPDAARPALQLVVDNA